MQDYTEYIRKNNVEASRKQNPYPHFRTYMNTNLKAVNQQQPVRWNGCPINSCMNVIIPGLMVIARTPNPTVIFLTLLQWCTCSVAALLWQLLTERHSTWLPGALAVACSSPGTWESALRFVYLLKMLDCFWSSCILGGIEIVSSRQGKTLSRAGKEILTLCWTNTLPVCFF